MTHPAVTRPKAGVTRNAIAAPVTIRIREKVATSVPPFRKTTHATHAMTRSLHENVSNDPLEMVLATKGAVRIPTIN
ncbi:MAG: hypothetical protein OIN88_04710 [Candidatus Methanoperedens sp.]|nr:hypothetical protein [Candidatus Methanoperedens sp.]